MNRGTLSNWVEGYFGRSVLPVVKNGLVDYLWAKIRVELDEAEDRGYWRGYDKGSSDAQYDHNQN